MGLRAVLFGDLELHLAIGHRQRAPHSAGAADGREVLVLANLHQLGVAERADAWLADVLGLGDGLFQALRKMTARVVRARQQIFAEHYRGRQRHPVGDDLVQHLELHRKDEEVK